MWSAVRALHDPHVAVGNDAAAFTEGAGVECAFDPNGLALVAHHGGAACHAATSGLTGSHHQNGEEAVQAGFQDIAAKCFHMSVTSVILSFQVGRFVVGCGSPREYDQTHRK